MQEEKKNEIRVKENCKKLELKRSRTRYINAWQEFVLRF